MKRKIKYYNCSSGFESLKKSSWKKHSYVIPFHCTFICQKIMALAGLVPPTDLQPRSYLVRHECNQITASDSTLIGCWCSAYLQLRNSLCEKGHKKDATLTPSHGGANLRLAFQSKLTLECVPVKTDFWYVPVKTLKGWRPAPVALHLHFSRASPCMWSARAQFAAIAFKLNLLKCYSTSFSTCLSVWWCAEPASGEREEAWFGKFIPRRENICNSYC